MHREFGRLTVVMACAALVVCMGSRWVDAGETTPILETGSFWRVHYTMADPVFLEDGKVRTVSDWISTSKKKGLVRMPKWIETTSALPKADWMKVEFNDSRWLRMAGLMFASAMKKTDTKSPFTALECLRGKFGIKDPSAAKGMTLSLVYRGGVVVYLNGKEIARRHLAKDAALDALAESTAAGEAKPRKIEDLLLPVELLRKGANVLAIESHRAAYRKDEILLNDTKWPQGVQVPRASCGVEKVALVAPNGVTAVMPNVVRPDGFQVWNSLPHQTDFDMDYGDPNEPLKPIMLAATRNGTFSGKVVVGSTKPIRGIKGTVSDLISKSSRYKITPEQIQVRYGIPDGVEAYADARYMRAWNLSLGVRSERPRSYLRSRLQPPYAFGKLLETPPAEIPVYSKAERNTGSRAIQPKGIVPVFGAVVPVWVTVKVPKDAAPGKYRATLTVTADGEKPVKVPVLMQVSAWTLPDPVDYRTYVGVVESPESLALAYDVKLWSDAHFKLIEAAFRQLGELGNKSVYVPLICETNLGNAQSMVRWVKQGDSFKPDFSAMDRYLDIVSKQQGKPGALIFYVWDSFLDRVLGGRNDEKWEDKGQKDAIAARKGLGPDVTVIDPSTGKTSLRTMPAFSSPDVAKAWRAVAEGIKTRVKQRGWADCAMMGMLCDYMPSEASAKAIRKLFPEYPWAHSAHLWPKDFYGIPINFKSNVFLGRDRAWHDFSDVAKRRFYGWKHPEMEMHFPRLMRDYFPLTTFRLVGEMSLMRNFRGFVRMGADFWPVLKNKRGEKVGRLAGRFPKTFWNNLNIEVSLLAEGPTGPVATARFEAMREGIQDCEARIAVERALSDPALRSKLGKDRASKYEQLLDDRMREVMRGTSPLMLSGHYYQWARNMENFWQRPCVVGHQYYMGSGWQKRSMELYEAAYGVEKKLGKPKRGKSERRKKLASLPRKED